MRIKFIINPLAGKGKALEQWKKIKQVLVHNHKDFKYVYTRFPEDAIGLAKEAGKEKYDILAVIGGDGTINEAVNGLIGSQTALAVFPGGTGNDFAKVLKIPKSIDKMINILKNVFIKSIDVAKCNDRYFINMAGTGFDAEVAKNVNGFQVLRGEAAYISGIIKALLTYSPVHLEVIIDGVRREEKATLVAVGNGEFIGGGIHMLPNADLEDGLLDICIIKETNRIEALFTLPAIYRGQHINHPKCTFLKAREIVINIRQNDRQVYNQIDGQVFCNQSLKIRVIPQAIRVLVPAD